MMLGGLCAQSPIVRRIDFSPVDSLLQAENEQPVVINFWATWCRPCVKELPYFAELKAPIRVILISLDFGEKTEEKLQKFISERGLNHIHWWLDEGSENVWIPKVDPEWSGAIPASVFLYKGHKKFISEAFESPEDLIKKLETFLTDIP